MLDIQTMIITNSFFKCLIFQSTYGITKTKSIGFSSACGKKNKSFLVVIIVQGCRSKIVYEIYRHMIELQALLQLNLIVPLSTYTSKCSILCQVDKTYLQNTFSLNNLTVLNCHHSITDL